MNSPNPAHFLHLEEELLRHDLTATARASLIADDFREFGASGRTYDKTQILDLLALREPVHADISDLNITPLARDVMLVTYRAARSGPAPSSPALSNPPPAVPQAAHSLRSSIWALRAGRWQLLFHQGTPLPHEAGPPDSVNGGRSQTQENAEAAERAK